MQEAKGQEPQTQRLGSGVSTREAQDLRAPTQFLLCPEGNGYAPRGSSILPFCGGQEFLS